MEPDDKVLKPHPQQVCFCVGQGIPHRRHVHRLGLQQHVQYLHAIQIAVPIGTKIATSTPTATYINNPCIDQHDAIFRCHAAQPNTQDRHVSCTCSRCSLDGAYPNKNDFHLLRHSQADCLVCQPPHCSSSHQPISCTEKSY